MKYLVYTVLYGGDSDYTLMTGDEIRKMLDTNLDADYLYSVDIYDVSVPGVMKEVRIMDIWPVTMPTIAGISDSDYYAARD